MKKSASEETLIDKSTSPTLYLQIAHDLLF